jgi:hypothetical protein
VERSVNGNDFTAIARVLPNSGSNNNYQFIDVSPVSGTVNHYRLKETGRNGDVHYSEIRIVRFDHAAAISVYPNPASGYITLEVNDASRGKTLDIKLYNAGGQIVMNKVISRATASEQVNIAGLAAGLYRLTIGNETTTYLVSNIRIQ